MIQLTEARYKELLDSERMLLALENAGVDNWNGYSYAMEEYNEETDEEL